MPSEKFNMSKLADVQTDMLREGWAVIAMLPVAPIDQLSLSWTQLSWLDVEKNHENVLKSFMNWIIKISQLKGYIFEE